MASYHWQHEELLPKKRNGFLRTTVSTYSMMWYFAGLKIWTIAHCGQWNSAVRLIKNVKAFWCHVTDQEVLSRSTFHLQMGKPQLSLIHISSALFWVSKVAAQILVWALQQAFIRASKKSGASREERVGSLCFAPNLLIVHQLGNLLQLPSVRGRLTVPAISSGCWRSVGAKVSLSGGRPSSRRPRVPPA